MEPTVRCGQAELSAAGRADRRKPAVRLSQSVGFRFGDNHSTGHNTGRDNQQKQEQKDEHPASIEAVECATRVLIHRQGSALLRPLVPTLGSHRSGCHTATAIRTARSAHGASCLPQNLERRHQASKELERLHSLTNEHFQPVCVRKAFGTKVLTSWRLS